MAKTIWATWVTDETDSPEDFEILQILLIHIVAGLISNTVFVQSERKRSPTDEVSFSVVQLFLFLHLSAPGGREPVQMASLY